MSITVGKISDDGDVAIIVADKGSNDVTILQGQGVGPSWTATPGGTIDAGLAPVRTALVDVNHDGNPDLVVCDSGSDDVALFAGQVGGSFAADKPTFFPVGVDPIEMLVGRFDKRPELDLVTVNSGSDDLTFIGGVFSAHPTSQSLPSGGTAPDAAFAIDPNRDGVLDLVVANGGDGHLTLLQGVNEGMQIAAVITQADVPVPTTMTPIIWSGEGVDFFAASAGQDVAELLHFDLGAASTFLATRRAHRRRSPRPTRSCSRSSCRREIPRST